MHKLHPFNLPFNNISFIVLKKVIPHVGKSDNKIILVCELEVLFSKVKARRMSLSLVNYFCNLVMEQRAFCFNGFHVRKARLARISGSKQCQYSQSCFPCCGVLILINMIGPKFLCTLRLHLLF